MKTKKTILTLLILMIGGLSVQMYGQNSIRVLVQKYENREDVRVSVVQNKQHGTKETMQHMTTITFRESADDAIRNEISTAFQKEKENAYQVIEERREDGRRELMYKFLTDTEEITYTYESRTDRISLTEIRNFIK